MRHNLCGHNLARAVLRFVQDASKLKKSLYIVGIEQQPASLTAISALLLPYFTTDRI